MRNNVYYTANKLGLAYFTEDLSYLFGKDDFDYDNTGYDETVRYRINKEAGYGTRRQFSVSLAENGLNSNLIGKLTMLEFIVTGGKYTTSYKVHGTEIITRGILSVAQVNHILDNLGTAELGSEYSNAFVFVDDSGNGKNVRVVQLRQGKRNERIILDSSDRLYVEMTYKNFERLPQKGKRKRILG